ncbi:BCCT family transporter [Ammoniphilus sp. YIM 78166]|uniref:BCCT family transporter n=1 Tax=Ammoniphilus sp. YIM 78166 TaxID=1644106 RepID=UPI0010704C05|nr:BCCT family transporter [Ammoniphilus sp. YIM 78166]
MKPPRIDKVIFSSAVAIIVVLSVLLLADPEQGSKVFGDALSSITGKFGTLYLWGCAAAFGLLIWLALSKYGHVKLGDEDTKPEFSTGSWIAMLFTAGIGSGLMYWGTIEWAWYYLYPPYGVEARSVEAADWAATYGMFHWGFTAWAIYCLPALPIAYAMYVRKYKNVRLSTACAGVIGEKHAQGLVGKVIDVFFMFGIIGGVGTSLGLATPLISESLSTMFGVEKSLTLDTFIILAWTVIFGLSVYSGLQKGLKILSDMNAWLFLAIAVFIFVFGPTVFILSRFTDSVGLLLQNFTRMSFYTDSVGGSGFSEGWTIFYWAWWVAYAPFMGIFVARISKGRTIRQLIAAELVGGTLGCWIAFAVLGNTSMSLQLAFQKDPSTGADIAGILEKSGEPAAIVATFQALPGGVILLAAFTILTLLFLATTLDSSAYTLADAASRDLEDGQEPAKWHRLFWAVTLGAIAIILMYGGGLKALQNLSVITSFPLIFVLGISTYSFMKWLKEDYAAKVSSESVDVKKAAKSNAKTKSMTG